MKIFKALLIAGVLLTSISSYGSSITFTSSTDDTCAGGCATLDHDFYTYVDPGDSDELSGAIWIQPDGAWFVDDASYTVTETELGTTEDSVLTSLNVSFDDDLIIYNGDDVIFDSLSEGISSAWTQIIDVFDYLEDTIYISSDDYLSFAVVNSLDYATGVVWKGSVEVPEPSVVLILGLALIAFGVKRRQHSDL